MYIQHPLHWYIHCALRAHMQVRCMVIRLRNKCAVFMQVTDTPCFKNVRDAEVRERINKHLLELTMARKQAGLVSSPSSELLQAEEKLAKVCYVLLQAHWTTHSESCLICSTICHFDACTFLISFGQC